MSKNRKNDFIIATDSSFAIEPENLQITFNYFYFLGYSLQKNKKIPNKGKDLEKEVSGYIHRDWADSEAAHYVRNNFLSEIMLDHFHLDPNILDTEEINVKDSTSSRDQKEFKFSIRYLYTDDKEIDESISSIECSILRNGHLVLSVRMTYMGIVGAGLSMDIPAYSVVDLIKKPESVRSNSRDKIVGNLILSMEKKVEQIEEKIDEILKLKGFERAVLEYDEKGIYKSGHTDLPPINGAEARKQNSSRSRPYIGVLFRFSDEYKYSQVEHIIPSIRRFVIATARTTPPFSTMFLDEAKYLDGRDIYKPGRSIVYIARRGWCVFDTMEQDRQPFMLGTVESTHMVVTVILSTARTWRIYIADCEKKGKDIFYDLNNVINDYISTPGSEKRERFIDELGKATSFLASARLLSPQRGLSKLLEAHAISHTARSAVRRCEDLTQLNELELISEERINKFLNFMGIAEDYLQVRSVDSAERNLAQAGKTLSLTKWMLGLTFAMLVITIFLSDRLSLF